MIIDTERLKIRDITLSDAKPFIEMASDGSLNDVGFDRNCSSWMKNWILEILEKAKNKFSFAEGKDGIVQLYKNL